ncbi:hydrogenase maturation protease [Pleurocapsales cyanobacterium LEGE 06147]|nr:hydrogenase maturation protease [Pleurocapsales cyanobacterium LEGE 06147]
MYCLVIGYGNTLRSDDGVGQIVAEKIANFHLPEVRSLYLHQLTPELAADIAEVELVIFVDACLASIAPDVRVNPLKPLSSMNIGSHTSDPRILLNLSHILYNHCPKAWWVTIPGENFELGNKISSLARRGMTQALKQIDSLIEKGKVY